MTDLIYQPFFWVLAAILLVHLLVYLLWFRRLAAYKQPEADPSATEPVSVIIAARNEEDNLRENLPLILEQDYPQFEVVVVNDQSEDETGHVLEELSARYPHLKVLTIGEHVYEFSGKKLALTLAIKAAKYEHLLFTDADCKPQSNDWIRKAAVAYKPETEIVLGFSPYQQGPGFLNSMIQFDTFYTALQYFSMALGGSPYMGVGRNLSYTRSLFFDNKGFSPYLKVSSGDDDLFVNLHANSRNTEVMLAPESFMLSKPKDSWSNWFRQKRRHQQTGKYYRKNHKRTLAFFWLSHILFYAAFIAGLFLVQPFWIVLIVLGVKWMVQLPIFYLALKKLQMQRLFILTPALNFLYQVFYLPLFRILSIFGRKKRKWDSNSYKVRPGY